MSGQLSLFGLPCLGRLHDIVAPIWLVRMPLRNLNGVSGKGRCDLLTDEIDE